MNPAPQTLPADPEPAPTIDPRVAQTRRVVIEATASLLTEEGFERLTIEGIAERSGVARSTIYRNWDDRSALLVDAFTALCANDEIPDLGSLERELSHIVHDLADGITRAEWSKALPSLIGAAHHDDGLAEALSTFSLRRRQRAAKIFERAMTRGEIDPGHDPMKLAEYLSAPLFLRYLMTRGAIDHEFLRYHVAMVVNMATTAPPD